MFAIRPVTQTLRLEVAYVFGGNSSTATTATSQVISYYPEGSFKSTGLSMSGPRTTMGSAFLVDSIYCLGGIDNTPTNVSNTQKFSNGVMSTVSVTSATRGNSCSALGSNIFCFGGQPSPGSNGIKRFTGTAVSTDAATLVEAISEPGAATLGSNVFAFGGNNNASHPGRIQRYDGTTRTTDASTIDNGYATPTGVLGSTIYIFGTAITTGVGVKVQSYDGSSVATLADLTSPVCRGACSKVGSRLAVIGGINSSTNALNHTVQLFNGSTSTTDGSYLAASNGVTASSIPNQQIVA